jgi:hypothetical protein
MRKNTLGLLCALSAMGSLVAGCHTSADPPASGDSGTPPPGGDAGSTDDAAGGNDGGGGGPGDGMGTCDTPIELATAGMHSGNAVTYMGSTDGAANNLHPYGGCVMNDGPERVFHFVVPAGTQALKLSTDGSAFNTVLYARTTCDQSSDMMAADLACNDDDFDHAPQSTLFLTGLMDNQDLFIVVDGNASMDAMGDPSGAFTLSVAAVTLGSMGNPCRPEMDAMGMPVANRCDGGTACSVGGGAPDGTAICVPPVAVGQACDTRAYTNTCTGDAICATDPSPPDGTMPMATCATPGTAAGTPCRMAEPRCNAPLVCGAGDAPMCVRELMPGADCDPMGTTNHCPAGTSCVMMDGGQATCTMH